MIRSISEATEQDFLQLKQEILTIAASIGIDKIGFASADPFMELKQNLEHRRDKGFNCGFEESNIDKRTNPELIFTNPQSILAIAVAYPSKLPDPPRSEPGAYRGILARSAWGDDYHRALHNRLSKLAAFIQERVLDARTEIMVDTGALVDRAVAVRAGIGWSGKNCSVITPEFGSWVYLGELITNLPFPPDQPVTEDCGDCTLCMDACPTHALVAPGVLDAQRCISYFTQAKDDLDDSMKDKIGNRLYGCDTCQVVCPKNKGFNWTHHTDLQPEPEKVKPLLVPLLTIGNREFKHKFGSGAAAWRGKKPLQRNAIIGLGKFQDQSAIPALSQLLKADPRPDIRAVSAWALGRIGGELAVHALTEASVRDPNNEVNQAAEKALLAQTQEHK
ncbi:MAG: tRNA epoxyqueuosine(34) reductase QueG [Gorillibacterium sp.]|nr:tRNA epoxyqueuosine(34) reductase QueG [Gorillibacterium sp.]